MKTILITGGSGLLALNWAQHKRSQQTIYLCQHKKNITLKGAHVSVINLEDQESIRKEFVRIRPDLVVHTAGLTNVEECEKNPELAKFVNTHLSRNVAMECQKLGIKLVHISTDHLFEGREGLVPEESEIAPLNEYAKSKAEAEKLVTDNCQDALIIRTNIFGWGMSYRKSFSDYILDNLRNEVPIRLFRDVHFSPILIADLVDLVEELVRQMKCGVYNVAASERISKLEFGCLLAEHFNLDSSLIDSISINSKTDLVKRPKDMSLSTQKLTSVLGFGPPSPEDCILKLKQQELLGLTKELRAL